MEPEQIVPPPVENATVSRGIRRARGLALLTQGQLADAIGVSRAKVSMWENGSRRPDSEEIRAIAEATGVSVGWLFGEVAA
jgi:transcriptional regulator with XRE-family HTH domain